VRRHRFDPLSFVFGVLFLGAAIVLSLGTYNVQGQTLTWIGAGLMLFVGFVLMVGSRSGRDRRSSADES